VCRDHSALDEDGKRYCARCLKVNSQERMDAERVRRSAEAARRASLPSMGYDQLIAYLRGERADAVDYLLRPVPGELLAQILADLLIPRVSWTFRGPLGTRTLFEVGWRIWEEEVEPPEMVLTHYLDRAGLLRVIGFKAKMPPDGQPYVCPPQRLRLIRAGVIRFRNGRGFFVPRATWRP
jgi:hypothetical protein